MDMKSAALEQAVPGALSLAHAKFRHGDSSGCLAELDRVGDSQAALLLRVRALMRLGRSPDVVALLRNAPGLDEGAEMTMLLGSAVARTERAEIGLKILERARTLTTDPFIIAQVDPEISR